MANKRANRKKEHVDQFLNSYTIPKDYFDRYRLIHNSLPELDFSEISLECNFLSKTISAPIMINAITGGVEEVREINFSLARIAKKLNIPIAVGSQSIALKEGGDIESFSRVREIVGEEGIVIANLSANMDVDSIKEAIKMIGADAIQLHINVAQEIIMPEGDRDFKGWLDNIKQIVASVDIPVIVKEVGFGINGKVAKRLKRAGVRYIDVSGKGGTNFIEIEANRNDSNIYKDFYNWGNPTPECIVECRHLSEILFIISSGGISSAEQIIKSLCLGANLVGFSGTILKKLIDEGKETTLNFIGDLIYKLKIYMLLLGAKDISRLNPSMIKYNQ